MSGVDVTPNYFPQKIHHMQIHILKQIKCSQKQKKLMFLSGIKDEYSLKCFKEIIDSAIFMVSEENPVILSFK